MLVRASIPFQRSQPPVRSRSARTRPHPNALTLLRWTTTPSATLRDDRHVGHTCAYPERDLMFLHLLQLGRVPYAEGLRVQAESIAARKAGTIGDTLLLLEHPPVLTLGRNATRANILATDELLAAQGRRDPRDQPRRRRDLSRPRPARRLSHLRPARRPARQEGPAPRPGRLRPPDGRSAHPHLRETSACPRSASAAAPASGRSPAAPSLEKKIAAIGVHVSQGVTSHGFALNVTTDLRDFDWIVPCGITDRAVTSLELEVADPPALAPTMENAAERAPATSAASSSGRCSMRNRSRRSSHATVPIASALRRPC